MRHLLRIGGVTVGLFVLILIAGAIVGSGGGTSGEAAQERPPTPCQKASAEARRSLEAGLTIDGSGTIRAVYVAESHEYPGDWYIAGELQGPGLDSKNEIAVWVTGHVEPSLGKPDAANGLAAEFSVWDAPAKLGPLPVFPDDPGKDAAITCVRAALKA